jgi:periplasmic copper chaperone A
MYPGEVMLKRLALFIYILIIFSLTGCWDNNLKIVDAWARPGIKRGNSAIYFGIDNPTGEPDVLLDVSCDIAEDVEIHLSKSDDQGLMTMELQETVTIEPRRKLIFQPGGLHVMLIDLQRDLEFGEKIQMQLYFQVAGEIKLEVTVKEQ